MNFSRLADLPGSNKKLRIRGSLKSSLFVLTCPWKIRGVEYLVALFFLEADLAAMTREWHKGKTMYM
jgi:hypothetical protein